MEFLKQFMRKNAYKLVYASLSASWIMDPSKTSVILFGELPFPTEEYMSIISKNRKGML